MTEPLYHVVNHVPTASGPVSRTYLTQREAVALDINLAGKWPLPQALAIYHKHYSPKRQVAIIPVVTS